MIIIPQAPVTPETPSEAIQHQPTESETKADMPAIKPGQCPAGGQSQLSAHTEMKATVI